MKPFTILFGACAVLLLAYSEPAFSATVLSGGYANDFSTQPSAADWSTLSIAGGAGGAGDSTTAAHVNTNVAALVATSITNQLALSNGVPPAAAATAVWSTNGYVQTRPTGNRITVLMASLINGTGADMGVLNVSYDLTLAAPVAEGVTGHQVYYSFTGAAGSWVSASALSGADTSQSVNSKSASLILGSWPMNANLYLLWADDNGSPAPDAALQIDNVVITATPTVPAEFITQPQDTTVTERGAVTFSFAAFGTLQNIQWYKAGVPIPGANATSYVLSSASVLDNGAQFHATVTNTLSALASSTATLTVLADTNAPVAFAATYDGISSNIVVRFTEGIDSNSINAVNFTVFETISLLSAPSVLNVSLLNGTNVLVSLAGMLTTGVSYSIIVAGIQDLAFTPNTMSPDPTTLIIRPSLVLIGFTNVWKYDINNGDRTDTGWQNVGFDDSAWPSGAAGLGRDNSINGVPINTIIPYMSNGVPVYFRKHFQLPSVPNNVTLTLRNVVEDGAVYYLNGKEILRRNMPAGPVIFTTLTISNQADATPIQGPFNVPANFLVGGDNVLAVEVHQSTINSTDVEMAAELTANIISPLTVPVFINEYMAVNTGSVLDPADGNADDWFELYNAGDSTVDLSGFHLTDILSNPNKFTIPSGVMIPPHSYLLFWADNTLAQGSNHVNFLFSSGGEAIGLFAPDFSLVDSITFGPQAANISQGRAPDTSGNIVSFVPPTPQALNPGPPVVTIQPQSIAAGLGADVFFSVGVTSSVPVAYQWHVNCRNIHNATNATLVISNMSSQDVGTYSVTVSSIYGRATSWDAHLEATNIVSIGPGLVATLNGTNVNLTWPVSAGSFQLQEAPTLDGPPAWTNSGASVSTVGANYFASVPINAAKKFYRLLGDSSSLILIQPLGRSAGIGDLVILSATAAGTPPFSYQWRLNGFIVPDATNATLAFNVADNSQFGAYQVYVDNATGQSARSRPAVVRPATTQTVLTDSFAARPLFTSGTGSIHGVTFGSTTDTNETNLAGLAGTKPVWLRWRAPASGVVSFDTIGSGFDTLLAAYTGTSILSLTNVARDDDALSNLWSRIRFNVTSNAEYSIALGAVAGAEGFFVLNWSFNFFPPTFTIPIVDVQPQDQVVLTNAVAVFSVTAHGLAPLTNLSYQWYFNGAPIPGSQTGTNASLTVGGGPGTAPSLLGPYFVDVSNGAGPALVVRSLPAFLQFSSTANTNDQIHFVSKPPGDIFCGTILLDITNCCGGSLTASGKDPTKVFASGFNVAIGGLASGPASGGGTAIKYWVWATDTFSSLNPFILTGIVSGSSKVQVQVQDLDDRGKSVLSPVATTATTMSFIPIAGHRYSIGIGREKEGATYTLQYSQSQ